MGYMKKRIPKTNTPMKALLTNTSTDSTDYRYGSLLNNPGNGSDIEDAENLSLQGEIHELTIEIDAFDKLAIIVNCLNALFGVALFVMPWGFQESGILGGLIIVSTVSVLSYETARILLLSQKSYYIDQGQIKSYPEIASAALGAKYHYIVQVATVISCLGGCTGYLIFLGQTLGQVFSIPAENVVIIGTLPLVLLSWIRTFSDLSYSTTLGIVAVVASIIALFADGMDHIIGDWTSVPLFIPSKAPNFLGPSTFLFTIHYCILSMGAEFLQSKRSMLLHNDIEDNQGSSISININLLFSSLSESIAISYVLTTATTVLVGCLGYLMYRNVSLVVDADGMVMPGCEQPVCQNVILNISPGIMSNVVAICMSLMILFSYLVLLVPAREHIEGAIISMLPYTNGIVVDMIKNTIRTSIVLSNVIIAIRAPYFGSMLGSVGGLTDAFLCFVVPPLIYSSIFKDDLNSASKLFYSALTGFGVCIMIYTIVKLLH